MTITLNDELEDLINEKIKSGAYKSADEVIAASLRLLKAKEEGMEALRREIMLGVEDIQQGRYKDYSSDAELEALSELGISDQGERMAAAMEKLASINALSDISDPSALQREQRQDRPLPDRDA
ncbi:MAG: type II toxin-antitoxin system ParD family antitoxin [Pyrinomonadaceae bacterium]